MAKQEREPNKAARVFAWLALAFSAFLSIGVMLIFHACGPKDDGTWMSCHYAQLAVCGIAAAAALLLLISLFAGRAAAVILKAAAIVCAAAAAVIPGNVIRLCMMNEMRCRAVMRPSVILLSVLIIVSTCASLFAGRKTKR